MPLIQVYAQLEDSHRALLQYVQELDLPVSAMPVQKRQPGLLKTGRRAPPTPAAAQLRGMVPHRQEWMMERAQRKNKLTAICDELFPEWTHIFRDPTGPTAQVFGERFPTPAILTAASLSALQDVRGKTRQRSNEKWLASESIGTTDAVRQRGLVFE
ncbi:MAG TPA: hypothetical protein VGF67_08205 [Ktedonobacteraceae bacterium]